MVSASYQRPQHRLIALAVILLTSAIAIGWTFDSAEVPTPTRPSDGCRFRYSHFHLLFTLPALTILYLLAAPFLTALDWHKLYLLPLVAFTWTTPWDNELVRRQAWWYPTSCVLATVGYVPVEEYAFFILQSLMTTLFTILVTRWSTPRATTPRPAARLLPILPALAAVVGLYTLFAHPDGQTSRYYLSMIAWWASPPLVLLWWGTGPSWFAVVHSGNPWPWLACVVIPTAFLCGADVFALRRGTWHISETRSLQVFVVPDLPIEETVFFLATNVILVSACFAFDRVVWQQRGEEMARSDKVPTSPSYFGLDWTLLKQVWTTFVRLDVGDEAQVGEGQRRHALAILARASKSFNMAASLLPWDLRVDIGSVYAFARAMDDFVDQPKEDTEVIQDARAQILLLRQLASIAFDEKARQSPAAVEADLDDALQQYKSKGHILEEKTEVDLRMSAHAASALANILPPQLWTDLIDGYATDGTLNGPRFCSFEEQADYAQSVAGSIGEMCVRIVLARLGITVDREYVVPRDVDRDNLIAWRPDQSNLANVTHAVHAPRLDGTTAARLLRDARRMGVGLQLVNIARDVYRDASELRRCYLVVGASDESGIWSGLRGGEAPTLSRQTIFTQKCHLLDVADGIYHSTVATIDLVPSMSARTGLRVACAVYADIGRVIRRDGPERCLQRSSPGVGERLWTAVKAVYWAG